VLESIPVSGSSCIGQFWGLEIPVFRGIIDAVEASSSHCQPPSVRLQIDVDLQFGPPFPE
jgi:hypothetical protein